MLKKISVLFIALALLAVGPVLAAANDTTTAPTFTRDVSPILQQRCQDCHRDGGDDIAGMIAPMSLVTYKDVRPWAKAIARAVDAVAEDGRMRVRYYFGDDFEIVRAREPDDPAVRFLLMGPGRTPRDPPPLRVWRRERGSR